jgi:hypothetical protein
MFPVCVRRKVLAIFGVFKYICLYIYVFCARRKVWVGVVLVAVFGVFEVLGAKNGAKPRIT